MLGLSVNDLLSREQMKKVMGGSGSGGSGSDGHCTLGATCGKWVGGATGHYESGTCAMGQPLFGLPATCECSNGGTGCTTTAN
ncbi:MAG: hypothetical protein ACTHM7_20460 [Ginsengibacter sp.]